MLQDTTENQTPEVLKELKEITREEAKQILYENRFTRNMRIVLDWKNKWYDIRGMSDEMADRVYLALTAAMKKDKTI